MGGKAFIEEEKLEALLSLAVGLGLVLGVGGPRESILSIMREMSNLWPSFNERNQQSGGAIYV
jgi:hypothetical protein